MPANGFYEWQQLGDRTGDYGAWLDGATPVEQAQALLRPCPEAALAAYPVGKAVGSVRNEGAGLIERLDAAAARPVHQASGAKP